MLALMPVVALAAACGNSASPGAATSLPSSALATDSGDASTSSLVPVCTVTSVALRTEDETSRSMIWVQAQYRPNQATVVKCAAPVWTADRKGLVVDSANPFRAGYARTLNGIVNVTATAPNGVQSSIRVDLGGTTDFAAPTGNEACRRIEDVNLRTVNSIGTRVRVQAVYSYPRPTTGGLHGRPALGVQRLRPDRGARRLLRVDRAAGAGQDHDHRDGAQRRGAQLDLLGDTGVRPAGATQVAPAFFCPASPARRSPRPSLAFYPGLARAAHHQTWTRSSGAR
jgi:hypothetical protein